MHDKSYIPGPYWTMDSSEAGLAFLIVCFILAIPAIPAGVLGWFIGTHVIGNNFAKWGLMILFFCVTYLVFLYLKHTKGVWYASSFVFLEYFIWDYSSMLYHEKETLVMQNILKIIFDWGLKT